MFVYCHIFILGYKNKKYFAVSGKGAIFKSLFGDIGYLTNGSARAGLIIMKFNFYGKNC